MPKNQTQIAISATLHELTLAIANQLNQAAINAEAASKLANRGNTHAAVKALMDVEPHAHQALDLFRAVVTINSSLMHEAD